MKRTLVCIILVCIMLSLCGCVVLDYQDKRPIADPKSYIDAAQILINKGEYAAAADIIHTGIKATNAPELYEMLKTVELLLDEDETAETAEPSEPGESIVMPTEKTSPEIPEADLVPNADVQYRINVFLSNFAEVFFDTYPCTKFEMLSFAYSHARINKDGKIYSNSSEYYISDTDANDILYKYFGVTYDVGGAPDVFYPPYENSMESIRYDGKYYYFPAADGAFNAYLAVARTMVENGDDTYDVEYDVFSMTDVWEDNVSDYYGFTSAQALQSSKLRYEYTGTATVKDYTRTNGKQSYHLLEMEILP